MSIGSWLRDRPRMLERAYGSTKRVVQILDPVVKRIGYERVGRWVSGHERWSKGVVFDCKMCGQCILHSTGMTCPMTCPKNLRNGACGGVRENGHCEVKPEMRCVWVEAYERSEKMGTWGHEITHIQPPVNRQLQDESSWVNMLIGKDKEVPEGWVGLNTIPVLERDAS